jgi:hypothetical protein
MIAQLVSAAVVGALSPVAALVAIVMLGGRRPLLNTLFFLLGWTIVLVALAGVLLAVLGGHEGTTGTSAKAAVGLILGVLLIGAGLRNLIGERHPLIVAAQQHRQEEGPGWLRRLHALSPLEALGVGTVVIAVSPADVGAYLAAVQALLGSDLDPATGVLVWVVLLACIDSCILIPLAVFVALPHRAPELLARGQAWILANQRKVTGWAAGFFGVVLIVNSVTSL